jgi:hypothetical protein
MDDADSWTCPTCRVAVATPYCPRCGERRLQARDLTLSGLLHQALQSFTNLDARLLRSLRCLVQRPGALTVLYLHGPRKPYIGPLALFLFANVLFVAMESLTSSNVFSTPLDKHLHAQPWSPLAQQLVARHVAAAHTNITAYAAVFDPAVAAHAKSLVILMVLPFALLPPLVFRRHPRPFVAHAAFSLHFHAFLLLLLSAALVVPLVDTLLGGPGLVSQVLDNAIAIALLLGSGLYLYFASGPVYEAGGLRRVLQAIMLTLAAMVVFLGYRFVLLLITLQTT